MRRNQPELPKTEANHPLKDEGILVRQEKIYVNPESLLHPFYRIEGTNIRTRMSNWLLQRYICYLRDSIHIWKMSVIEYKTNLEKQCSVKIQRIVRMWSLRNKIPRMREEWFRCQYEKWRQFHSQFNYSSSIDPHAVTFDNKIYFKTKRDANHYIKLLRAAVLKFTYHFEIHRTRTLNGMFQRWRESLREMEEASRRLGHWDVRLASAVAGPDETEKEKERMFRLHGHVHQSLRVHKTIEGAKSMGISDDDRKFNNVAAIPLAVRREAEEGAPPPAVPATGVSLPPLPEVPAEIGVDGGPVVHPDKRPKFNSYLAKAVGPTDYSCWIIPGVLAMGALPVGAARIKKRASGGGIEIALKDAVSKLIQAGVGHFISLLPQEEEQQELTRRSVSGSVESSVKASEVEVRKSLKQSLLQFKFARDTETVKLEAMPTLHHTNERFAAMEKEKTKRQYKILVATRDLEQATAEVAVLSEQVTWRRCALSSDPCPNKHELLPVIWAVEELIARKQVVYVYSNDGHGRAGLVCGCVLGRLYDLPAKDTLFRLQLHHGSYVSLQDKPAVSCPQSQKQRILIQQVIEDTSRVYDGNLVRTQVNPEIHELRSEQRKPSCSTVQKKKKKNAPPDPIDTRCLHTSLPSERDKVVTFANDAADGSSWQRYDEEEETGTSEDEVDEPRGCVGPWDNQGVRVRYGQAEDGNVAETFEYELLRPDPAEKPTLPLLRNKIRT